MAPNLCCVHYYTVCIVILVIPYCWLSLCTFYTTLLSRFLADAAIIRDFDRACGSVQFGSVRFTLVACAVKITFGSFWFNMASVDIINFENKYDYPDNYEL